MPFCHECGKEVELDWDNCPFCSHILQNKETKRNVQSSENKAGLDPITTHLLYAKLFEKNLYYRNGFKPNTQLFLFFFSTSIILFTLIKYGDTPYISFFTENKWRLSLLFIFTIVASFLIVIAINNFYDSLTEKKMLEQKKKRRKRIRERMRRRRNMYKNNSKSYYSLFLIKFISYSFILSFIASWVGLNGLFYSLIIWVTILFYMIIIEYYDLKS